MDLIDIVLPKAKRRLAMKDDAVSVAITRQSLGVLVEEIDKLRKGDPDRSKVATLTKERDSLQVELDNAHQAIKDATAAHNVYVDELNVKWQAEVDRLNDDLKAARLVQPHAFVQRNARATSQRAANAVLGRSGSQRVRVLQHIVSRAADGATDDEVALALDMMPPRVGSRRSELTAGSYVEPSALIPTRKTRNGQDAVVWIATQKALDALRALEQQEGK